MLVNIEKLIYGGEGLAHHEGATVFVPLVLPGEKVEASAIERKKKFVRARFERVVEPSPERVAAPCPHFGVCGGCNYQHIPYEGQLQYKIEILRETLRRLGRIEWTGEIKAHASPPWNYRNRAQWKIRPAERPAVETGSQAEPKLAIGYFRANTTALCAVRECPILSPLLEKTLQALRAAVEKDAFPRALREIEAFANADDSKLLLTATFSGFPSRAAELAETFRGIAPQIESLLFFDPTRERMELFGPGFIDYETLGVKYRVGHLSFFQVNRFLVEDLAREVAGPESTAGEGGGRGLALDLYAGVGLFAAPLARHFEHVVAVESNPAAARDLQANVLASGSAGARAVEVRANDAEQFLERYKEKPDLVVLDPPRAGLEPGAVKRLLRIAPRRIAYVSCEPPTLARDLAALLHGGYDIEGIQLFDLFPQTFHMEAVARLRRRA